MDKADLIELLVSERRRAQRRLRRHEDTATDATFAALEQQRDTLTFVINQLEDNIAA